MELVIETPRWYPCGLSKFLINEMEADKDDFGNMSDESPEDAPQYGCGNKMFMAKMPTQEVLDKYRISLNEYSEVCDKLSDELHVGRCSWCA